MLLRPGSTILGAVNPTEQVTPILDSNKSMYNDYAIWAETFMACPLVAGVAALLNAKYPKQSPVAIRSSIITTTNPLDNSIKPIKEWFYTSHIGASLIDPIKALDLGLIYDAPRQDYINLLCYLNFATEQLSSIIKSSSFI